MYDSKTDTSNDPVESITAGCVCLLIGIPVYILHLPWYGFVLSKLWGWFLVPVLGAPAIGIVGALGVALVIEYITDQDINQQSESPSHMLARLITRGFVYPAMMLLIGWGIQLFM